MTASLKAFLDDCWLFKIVETEYCMPTRGKTPRPMSLRTHRKWLAEQRTRRDPRQQQVAPGLQRSHQRGRDADVIADRRDALEDCAYTTDLHVRHAALCNREMSASFKPGTSLSIPMGLSLNSTARNTQAAR